MTPDDSQSALPEQLFRRVVESVRDYAIFALSPSGHIVSWNVGAQRIKGYTASEIIGRHFSIFYPPDDVQAGKCELELECASRDGRFEDEGHRVRKDGSRFWANVIISAMHDEQGRLIGFSKVTRDLTERKHAEEERAARRIAEEANRAKDEFLAMLGHELRNPLAPITTALELMRVKPGLDTTAEQRVIERQVRQMTRLVDDLLDIARITRGGLELNLRRRDLRDIVWASLEAARPLFEQRRHHLDVRLPDTRLEIAADDARLIQVLTNLLVNAAKYTAPGGHVLVEAARELEQIVVRVQDDGQGIEPALLEHVFELFVQQPQSVDRSEGGLGIGLTLVRTLVGLHGGTVTAASPGPGRGSTFTVRLPATSADVDDEEQPSSAAIPARTVAPRRVLVVDDNEDAAALLAELLTTIGHEVVSASDGPQALELLERFVPEVAILDIGLPGMDGYALGRALSERLGERRPLLIAVSGYGRPADLERSRQAGFDAHLVKPVDASRLVAAFGGSPNH